MCDKVTDVKNMTVADNDSPRSVGGGGGGNISDGLDTTFQFDEDTIQSLSVHSVDAPVVRSKKRKSRRKRLSESLSQPRFSDSYKYSGDPFLGCGSYGSVYTCSSLKGGHESKSHKEKSISLHPDSPKYVRSEGLLPDIRAEAEEEDEEQFAVKIIDKKGHSRSRLFNEIEILHQCKDHPNIVQLLDFIEEDHSFFLIFEKINGGPLSLHLIMDGRIAEREASLVTRDIATALEFLHSKGIAHRDLKPANILCVHQDCVAPVKLCDFDLASAPWARDESLACEVHSEECLDLMSPVGSAEFMAPEVVSVFLEGMSAMAYDKRCDLWSLGVILYYMLFGEPPFKGHCGNDCGWYDGEICQVCEGDLWRAIREDVLRFPETSTSVSDEALNLVTRLLERDISKRLTATEALEHDWLKIASSATSNPIPLNLNAPRMRKLSGAAKATQEVQGGTEHMSRQVWKFTYNNALHEIPAFRTKSKDGSLSPEERERLGTEDSGFGGDHVSGVVGLLIDAVNDVDAGRRCEISNSDSGIRMGGCSLKNLFYAGDKQMKSKDCGSHQFEFSDDESLFSSGYGFSIDLPPGSFADRCQNLSLSTGGGGAAGEEYGFESVNKQQLELEIALANRKVAEEEDKRQQSKDGKGKITAKGQEQCQNPLNDCTSYKLNDRNYNSVTEMKLLKMLGDQGNQGLKTNKSFEAIRSLKSSKP